MNTFQIRATEPEMLDQPDLTRSELITNLKELDIINNYLGGHATTIKGIKYFIKKYGNVKSIIDIGCGGGDTLGAVAKWSRKHKLNITLTGIDILPEAIEFARSKYGMYDINFICCDFNKFNSEKNYDLAINSLICHHFYEDKLLNFIKLNRSVSNYGFIINDLHRHSIAYHSISVLTKFFSSSYMVKNDAPLSVKKGFNKKELESILKQCGINKYNISWEWAFRYLIIADHGKL